MLFQPLEASLSVELVVLFLSLVSGVASEGTQQQQQCRNTISKAAYRGRYFGQQRLQINTTEHELEETHSEHRVGDVHYCGHLCRTQTHDCYGISYTDETRRIHDPNCFLHWTAHIQDYLVKDVNYTTILFLEQHCGKNSAVDGVWSAWYDAPPCPEPCPILNHLQRRHCLHRQCSGHKCPGTSVRRTPCMNNECRDIDTIENITETGIYTFRIRLKRVPLFCEVSEGKVWIHIQRRIDGSLNFNWSSARYRRGFGNVSHEFWLGNDNIHDLTAFNHRNLLIGLYDGEEYRSAAYSVFNVGTFPDGFRLYVDGYSGNATDAFAAYHNNEIFTTSDVDGDEGHCAQYFQSGWWFLDCLQSNLNGVYHSGPLTTGEGYKGIIWMTWKGEDYSLSGSVMKITMDSNNNNDNSNNDNNNDDII